MIELIVFLSYFKTSIHVKNKVSKQQLKQQNMTSVNSSAVQYVQPPILTTTNSINSPSNYIVLQNNAMNVNPASSNFVNNFGGMPNQVRLPGMVSSNDRHLIGQRQYPSKGNGLLAQKDSNRSLDFYQDFFNRIQF